MQLSKAEINRTLEWCVRHVLFMSLETYRLNIDRTRNDVSPSAEDRIKEQLSGPKTSRRWICVGATDSCLICVTCPEDVSRKFLRNKFLRDLSVVTSHERIRAAIDAVNGAEYGVKG